MGANRQAVIDWSEARVEQLKTLWAEGKSGTEIAKIFGGSATRNAVIAKANRLGLPLRDDATKALNRSRSQKHRHGGATAGPAKVEPRAQARVFGETRVKPALIVAGNGAVIEKPPGLEPKTPPVPALAWAPLPGVAPVSILDLGPHTCRWPLDLSGADLPMFCGALPIGGVYCLSHGRLSRPRPGAKEHLDEKLGIAAKRRAA